MQRTTSTLAALMSLVLLIALVTLIGAQLAPSPPPSTKCEMWPAIGGTLQQALDAHTCVEVQSGTHYLQRGIVIKSGRALFGTDQNTVTLKVDVTVWSFGIADAIVSHEPPPRSFSGPPQGNLAAVHDIKVSNITLDGSGLATYGILADGMAVDRVTVRNARCSAIGIHGPRTSLTNSTFYASARNAIIPGRGLVNCATVPDGMGPSSYGGTPLGAAVSAMGYPNDRDWAPHIENNLIINSVGPALDVNEVNGGKVVANTIRDNSGWAAISLFGSSGWEILDNNINHPPNQPGQPYHPHCVGGPIGPNSAAIFLCQDEYAQDDGVSTANNVIAGNRVSSGYGILSIGATQLNPAWVPFANRFNANDPQGSLHGCADANKPTSATPNIWTANHCAGQGFTSSPTYF